MVEITISAFMLSTKETLMNNPFDLDNNQVTHITYTGDWGNVSGTLSAGSWAQVVVGVALFIAQCGVLTKRAELKYLIKRGT